MKFILLSFSIFYFPQIYCQQINGNLKGRMYFPNSKGDTVLLVSETGIANDTTFPVKDDCAFSSLPGFDKNDDHYHHYELENKICNTSKIGCTIDKVFKLMISNVSYLAPAKNTNPVQNCSKTLVNIPVLGPGSIITFVNEQEHWIINYALKGHPLFPGYIKRKVVEKNGSVYVATNGEGTGGHPLLNELFAKRLWSRVDKKLRAAFDFIR